MRLPLRIPEVPCCQHLSGLLNPPKKRICIGYFAFVPLHRALSPPKFRPSLSLAAKKRLNSVGLKMSEEGSEGAAN